MHEKLWTKNFIIICAAYFLTNLYPSLLIPTFPFYLKSLGGSEMTIGLTASLFSAAAILTRPLAGVLVDRYSRSLPLLCGLSVVVLVSLGYAFLPILAVVLTLRLLHGLVHGMLGTAISTNACDTLPESRFSEGMGFFGMMTALPLAIAPALGLFVMEQAGFRVLFLLLTGLIVLALLLALCFHYLPIQRSGLGHFSFSRIFERSALPASLIVMCAFLPYSGMASFIALYAAEKGLGGTGTYFVFWAVASTSARFFFGRLCDRRGERLPILIGNSCFICGLLLTVLANGPLLFWLSGFIYGCGFGVCAPALQTMSVRISPPARRGAASSTYLIFCDLGNVLGGALSGLLVTLVGYSFTFLLLIISCIASILLYELWGKHTPSAFRQVYHTPTA